MQVLMSEKDRVTIMLDVRIMKKLRVNQSKEMIDSRVSVSLSRIINENLAKYYKMPNYEY